MKRFGPFVGRAGRANIPLYWLGAFVVVVLLALLVFLPSVPKQAEVEETEKPEQTAVLVVPEKEEQPVAEPPAPPEPVSPQPPAVVSKSAPATIRVAIIIDDLGADLRPAKRLLAIDASLTFSILPHLKNSRKVARLVMADGKLVMLHIPMEPKSKGHKAGPGVLLVSHDEEKIRWTLNQALDAVPEALGVNNHMGSLFTANAEKMTIVLKEIGARDLFFVDSRTSAKTVAYDTAIKLGVPSARRDVFLDNERDKTKISANLLLLGKVAKKNGTAIALGHPYPETIRALEEMVPKLLEMGVAIVPVSELLVTP